MTPRTSQPRLSDLPLAATSAPGLTSSPAGGGFSHSGTRPHPRREAPGYSPIHSPGLIPGRQPVARGMESHEVTE